MNTQHTVLYATEEDMLVRHISQITHQTLQQQLDICMRHSKYWVANKELDFLDRDDYSRISAWSYWHPNPQDFYKPWMWQTSFLGTRESTPGSWIDMSSTIHYHIIADKLNNNHRESMHNIPGLLLAISYPK